MVDVLRQLPHLAWRGIEVPCVSIEGGFQHESADQKFQFRDEELIESLGRRNLTLAYQIPFREDLWLTPAPHLFTVVFPKFLDACLDRSRGTLLDPVLGELPAKVTQFRYRADPTRRDGVDVEVEFVKSPKQGELAELDVRADEIEGNKAAAKSLDQQAALVDWKQEPSPEATLDPLSAITSVFDQVSANIDKVARAFDNAAFKLDKMNRSIDRVANVRDWPVKRSVLRLSASLQRTREHVGSSGRAIKIHELAVDMQRGALATALNNSLGDLITLNPQIAQAPVVRAKTRVRYYAA